jgi:hypothetical protein
MKQNPLDWLKSRVSEPSTHAGLALLCQAAAAFLPQYAMIFQALTAVFGGAAVIKKDPANR